ncbi:MAG: fumarylacetoacetate hydrolase family protein [Anaerolineaceae bacterium]|jgi:2-keto-4-pentenoate hydratase/2-oxohepta-3-ene-1,7-dioic acid hydratase in catechol pathway
MKIVRFQTELTPPQYGWVDEDRIGVIEGDPFGESRRYETEFSLSEVELLLPCEPGKVIGIARNYSEHIREMGRQPTEVPLIFLKPLSSLLASGQPIILPPQSQQVEHEAELAVVIKKKCRWLKIEEAKNVIFGYSIGNDVTARDLQQQDVQYTRGKGFDTFCPFGPWIETEFDPSDALISCHVNNTLTQMASTREMIYDVFQLISFITSVMTLYPGDVILTGTPAGVSKLSPGDTVSIHIDGIGNLSNPVIAEPTVN